MWVSSSIYFNSMSKPATVFLDSKNVGGMSILCMGEVAGDGQINVLQNKN